jgi:hypothetical protein
MDTFNVRFTPELLEQFKQELVKHDDENDTFEFQGKRWLVSYARLLAHHLTGVFIMGRQDYRSDE